LSNGSGPASRCYCSRLEETRTATGFSALPNAQRLNTRDAMAVAIRTWGRRIGRRRNVDDVIGVIETANHVEAQGRLGTRLIGFLR
jgi:hypothetical protein